MNPTIIIRKKISEFPGTSTTYTSLVIEFETMEQAELSWRDMGTVPDYDDAMLVSGGTIHEELTF